MQTKFHPPQHYINAFIQSWEKQQNPTAYIISQWYYATEQDRQQAINLHEMHNEAKETVTKFLKDHKYIIIDYYETTLNGFPIMFIKLDRQIQNLYVK